MKIIVAFTSYPPRIGTVHKVVESLHRQTVRADEIVLYLSMEEFPRMDADLPDELKKLTGVNGFRVAWVPGNLKSHKKYYYALQKYKSEIVITVDDDTIYAATMIGDLMSGYQRFPDAVSARRARIILKKGKQLEQYSKWDGYLEEYADMPRMDLCAIGVGGVLYPPMTAGSRWFEAAHIVGMAEHQDDLWLKYNELSDDIPVVYIRPSEEDQGIGGTAGNALANQNLYSGANDTCMARLQDLLKREETYRYESWIDGLLSEETYIGEKKNYYHKEYRHLFDMAQGHFLYLYGAGKIADVFLQVLEDWKWKERISALLVSDKAQNPSALHGIPIKELSEIDCKELFYVIVGVGEKYQGEVQQLLKKYNCRLINLDLERIYGYFTWRTRLMR